MLVYKSPSHIPLPSVSLRVDSRSPLSPPARFPLLSGGVACRRGRGGAARIVYSSSRFGLAFACLCFVPYEGRSVDSGDQIRRAGISFFFAALYWWQVVVHGKLMDSRIPLNKVRIRSFEFWFLGQAWLCFVVLLLAVLPWWESKAVKMCATESFVNKAYPLVLVCYIFLFHLSPPARGGCLELDGGFAALVQWQEARFLGSRWSEVRAAPPSSSGRHGGGRGSMVAALFAPILDDLGVVMLQITAEHSRRPGWQPTLMIIWWSTMLVMASDFNLREEALPQALDGALVPPVPSGCVPGAGVDGCGLSLSCDDGSRGPNCFFPFSCRVFLAKGWDRVVILFFLKVLTVICTCFTDN